MEIDEKTLQLTSVRGFVARFWSELPLHESRRACFEVLNDEYEAIFGEPRFVSFDAFKKVISRGIMRKKGKSS